MGVIEVPGGMYEWEGEGRPGCWIVTASGAGGDPDTAALLLRVVDDARDGSTQQER